MYLFFYTKQFIYSFSLFFKVVKILFVCLGNVARSQMAEAFYNYYTNSKDACSAGTDPTTPKKYPKIPDIICQAMLEEGIDISHNKVKTVNKRFVEEADRIYVMCKKEECPDFLLESTNVTYWDVDDPYLNGYADLRKIRDEIKTKVLSVIE